MALVIGHSQTKYLQEYLDCGKYSVFSYPGYRSHQLMEEEILVEVAPFFSVIVIVVGANDIGRKSPGRISDDLIALCRELHAESPRGVPLPFASKDRKKRMNAIGEEVAKSDYEVAVFQEVWNKKDYQILKDKICKTLPFTHYYYSGMIGSGLCIFSKYRIMETLYHKFDLNGYVHKVQHGDWFGGKGVGLAKIDVKGFVMHLYVTHIHAEYNRDQDEYLPHRVAQAFNLSQFINLTSTQADLAVLCGDLNLEPVDLGYKIIRTNSNMRDSWLEKKSSDADENEGNTCDCPTNSYCQEKNFKRYPKGKRIDYILYQTGKGIDADVTDCSVVMGTVPGQRFNFSDHEAVTATMSLQKKPSAVPWKSETELSHLLLEALSIINKGLEQTRTNSRFYVAFIVVCVAVLYGISVIHIPYPIDFFVVFLKVALILLVGFALSQSFIMIRSEVHGLEQTRDDIKHVVDMNQPYKS